MKKSILLMFIAMLCLVGCSSFYFGCKDKEEKEDDLEKPTKIQKTNLSKEDIIEFRKRTDPHYQGIVLNNRSIISKSIIDLKTNESEQWLDIMPHLDQHISKDVQNIINSQTDAQKYINLLLSLLTEDRMYQASVLETNDQAPYYPGRDIFITRKEIENCQDEAILAEILSFRLVRNDYLNKHIDYSLFDKKDVKKALTEIIQKDRSEWEHYALDSSNNLNPEITDKVAVIMIRAGFKPSFSFSLDALPGFHSPGPGPNKSLEYITPLKRHKKVFD